MATSLVKLHLSPEAALAADGGIIVGARQHPRLSRIPHERVFPAHPLARLRLGGLWPWMRAERPRDDHRCQFWCLCSSRRACPRRTSPDRGAGSPALWAVLIAGIVNIVGCLYSSRGRQGVGHSFGLPSARRRWRRSWRDLCSERTAPVRLGRGRRRPTHRRPDLLHLKESEQSRRPWLVRRSRTFDGICPLGSFVCLSGMMFRPAGLARRRSNGLVSKKIN